MNQETISDNSKKVRTIEKIKREVCRAAGVRANSPPPPAKQVLLEQRIKEKEPAAGRWGGYFKFSSH